MANQRQLTARINKGFPLAYKDWSGLTINRRNLKDIDCTLAVMKNMNLIDCGIDRGSLIEANLSSSNLTRIRMDTHAKSTIFNDCIIRDAVLRGIYKEASFKNADLSYTDMEGTDLRRADFTGAALWGTCLVEEPNGDVGAFTIRNDRAIGYRTKNQILKEDSYQIGQVYTAPWFSGSDTECHPGLYLFPSIEQVKDFCDEGYFPYDHIIEVSSERHDVHHAGTKWRTRSFRVERVI